MVGSLTLLSLVMLVQIVSSHFDNVDLVLVFSFNAIVTFSHSQPAHILVKKLVSDCKLFIFHFC